MIMNILTTLHYCHYIVLFIYLFMNRLATLYFCQTNISLCYQICIDMRCKISSMHICIICRLVSLKLHYIATDCMLIDLGRWVTTSSLTIWRKKWFRPAKLLQRSIIDLLTLGTAQSCWNLAWRAPVRSVTNLLKTSPLAQSWDCLTYR